MENQTVPDPTENVREILKATIERQDSLRIAETTRLDHNMEIEVRRVDDKFKDVDEKFKDVDVKYQIQFNAAKEALGIALIAQEKAVSAALDSTKEAIGKAEIATDKRFDLLSEKIDGVNDTLNKNAGAQGIYVTHTDLSTEMEKLRISFEGMLRPVITFMNNSTGKSAGLNSGWAILLGAVGLVSMIVGIILSFSR